MRKVVLTMMLGLSVIVLVVAMLFGTSVLTVPTSGTPLAAAPQRAQAALDGAITEFAAAPGATYNGSIGAEGAELKDFQVTAGGDAHGEMTIHGKPAEIVRVDDTTYAKASTEFWESALGPSLPSKPSFDPQSLGGQWAAVSDDLLGFPVVDLMPRNLGLALRDGPNRLPDDLGAPSGPSSDTPDARGTIVDLPVDIEQDGDTVRAGDAATTIGPDGMPVAVIGNVTSGDAPSTSRLKVTVMTNAEVISFYSTVQGLTDPLKRVPLPGVDVPEPTGDLAQCGPGCSSVTYDFTNSAAGGADRGTVTVEQSTDFTVHGSPAGSCSRTVVMRLNGTASSTCLFTFVPPSGVRRFKVGARSRFRVKAHVEKDVKVLIESLDRNKRLATEKPRGQWYPQPYKINQPSRDYDRQVTGNTSGFAYVVGGYPFDGIEPDGTLLMTAGPGYDEHVRGDAFDPAWAGAEQLVTAAKAQRTAAGAAPVRWVFAEKDAGAAARKLLADNKISGIDVVVIPAADR